MQKSYFESVTPNVNFPELEERVIAYWKKNKIFEKSIESRPADKTWTFLDGPPFITGLPHYGTLLSSIPKDLFPRYKTMQGYRVRRVWGWDCHGLPAENKVEEKLKVKRKKEIEEKIGVKKFIDECKAYVKNVSSEWEWYVDHIGRWADFTNAYKTMDMPYMETVMWVFKQMYEKDYIYKGLRVSLYCPHCSTPVSNFEVAMDPDNYKDVTEPTAVYKYQLVDQPNTYVLAWSTTPWNKIATPALAVNPSLDYVKIRQGNQHYILSEASLPKFVNEPYGVVEKFKGQQFVGKEFIPHYDFYNIEPGKKAFIVVGGDFVTADEGTGIVTIAAYGEEDLAAMLANNIQIVQHIDDEGVMKPDVPKWAGKYYLDTNPLVIEDLQARNLIYRVDDYAHSVPTCWRCHTRLIYAPQDAWYVNVQKLKPKLKETNEVVKWYPQHFKYGRYLKSLEAAPDWCISRSRYWGSPVPVWECECGERFVPGSIAELEERSGKKITDLHKPAIDDVTVVCAKCGKIAHRVREVLDSWIEAGSASFAERHFPFDPSTSSGLEEFFPPDFIVEYTGQIRAWFYVLHVISVALFGSHAFKNVLVSGVILGTDGRKMSKNYGNYPDPKEMIAKYGGDALRLYLMGSPVMHGEDIRISEEQYRNGVRGLMLVFWNAYNFFVVYASVDGWVPKNVASSKQQVASVLDEWILALLDNLVTDVTKALEGYDTVEGVRAIEKFVDNLSTWYVRRSRDRIGATAGDAGDKHACYETFYTVLTTACKVIAPFIPFFAEEMYRNLTKEASVHLAKWPEISNFKFQISNLEEKMGFVRKACEMGHSQRKENKMKVRQPLQKFKIQNSKFKIEDQFVQLIKDELNIKEITISEGDGELKVVLDTTITPELAAEGMARELMRKIQMLRKETGCRIDERVGLVLPASYRNLSDDLLAMVKRETLADTTTWGAHLSLSRSSGRSDGTS